MSDDSNKAETDTPAEPLLRVVRGNPDDAELAALTTVIAGLAGAAPAEPAEQPRRSLWADPAHRLGTPPRPGPGGWRASALPRHW